MLSLSRFTYLKLESSVFCLVCLLIPPWFICEWLFLCSKSLCCDLKLMPHLLDTMDASSLLSRQYGVAAGGKKGFPQALLLCIYSSPSLLLYSVTHHWRILTKPHELLFRLSLLCFLSLVIFCRAVVDVLHCWYESKHVFVSHTIVEMFPWLQDCSWCCCWVGLQGNGCRNPEEDPIFLSDSHKQLKYLP